MTSPDHLEDMQAASLKKGLRSYDTASFPGSFIFPPLWLKTKYRNPHPGGMGEVGFDTEIKHLTFYGPK